MPGSRTGRFIEGVSPRQVILAALVFFMTAVGVAVMPSAQASVPASSGSTSASGPHEAVTSILVTQLSGLNLATDTFNATFYVRITCANPCPSDDWTILNAQSISREAIYEEGNTTWWMVTGTFTFLPELRLFPFDTQNLYLRFEHNGLDSTAWQFVPDPESSEVASEVSISGWETEEFEMTSSTTEYAIFDESYSRLTFTVPVTRSTIASITKYYVPLAIFVLLGGATLVLARYDFQVGTGGSALVGMTVFYLATSGGVGTIGYLTVWDASILLGYLLLGLVLLCGIVGLYRTDKEEFEEEEGEERSRRMRRRFQVAFGLLAGIGAATIAVTAVVT